MDVRQCTLFKILKSKYGLLSHPNLSCPVLCIPTLISSSQKHIIFISRYRIVSIYRDIIFIEIYSKEIFRFLFILFLCVLTTMKADDEDDRIWYIYKESLNNLDYVSSFVCCCEENCEINQFSLSDQEDALIYFFFKHYLRQNSDKAKNFKEFD